MEFCTMDLEAVMTVIRRSEIIAAPAAAAALPILVEGGPLEGFALISSAHAQGLDGRTRVKFKLRLMLTAMGALLAAPVAMGAWAVGLQAVGNFHVVEQGSLYRSAQLSRAELDELLNEYGIRTVINLRGASKGASWYDDEIAASDKPGVGHIDIGMSARAEPSSATIGKLIEALRDAPRPILVHCKDGADRTGLASKLSETATTRRAMSQPAL